MDILFWIAQAFGLSGAIFSVVGMQKDKKNRIFICYVLSNFSYAISFFLLKAYTGSMLCFMQGIETLVNYSISQTGKKIPKWLLILYFIIAIGFGIYSYTNPIDLLAIMGGVTYVCIIAAKNEKNIRKLTFLAAAVWIIYDFTVRSYVAGISDTFLMISTIIGMYRFDKKIKKEKSD